MKLADIEGSLPHGFHDALLKSVRIDYIKREATFDFSIWVGDISSEEEELREAYREGRLKLFNLLFCIIEAPDPTYPFSNSPHLRVDAGPSKDLKTPHKLPYSVPSDAFVYWFFVNEWNSFIHVAATDASFDWV